MNQRYQRIRHPEKLSSYWKSQWGICILIAFTGLFYNFGMILTPYFEGFLVDSISAAEESTLEKLPLYLWLYLLAIVFVEISRALKRYSVRRFANNALIDIKAILFNNLLCRSVLELEQENIGSLLARIQSDSQQSVEGMRKLSTEIFDTVTLFIFYIVYLLILSLKITLFALIPVAIAIFFAFFMRKKVYLVNKEARKSNSKLTADTYDLFSNAILFRLYSRDKENLKNYDSSLSSYERKSILSSFIQDIVTPLSNAIALASVIPILLFGSNAILSKEALPQLPLSENNYWTIGVFTSYLTTFTHLALKASKTAKLFTSVEKGLSSWKRIEPCIKPYRQFDFSSQLNESDELVLNDFSLQIEDRILFQGLNLKAKKGEVIGITGPIASGKSAFGKVFLKELNYQGNAFLFEKELKDFSNSEIKGNIVYMGHHPELLSESIRTNIAFESQKDVNPYLEAVSFTKDMEAMPQKENTMVGTEGMKLSGGQQQRLSLARTLYHKKGLIILDDPFASVDIKTEHEIMKSLKNMASDSLIFLISHRLSYFSQCDQVIVINKDGTVDVSTHENLLNTNPTYQEIHSLQKMEVNHE